jgi:DNA ligase D-like protein (predicted ligase)
MRCIPVQTLPEGPAWSYELKFDGYRAIGVKSKGGAQLFSRKRRDFVKRFRAIADALKELPDETVVDGEILAFDSDGRPSFNVLQNHLDARPPLRFYIFDVMMLAGRDLMRLPLDERRAILMGQLAPRLREPVFLSEPIDAPADAAIEAIRDARLEGIVAKRRDSVYEAGRRSGAWVKFRINQAQELVIGGYTPAPNRFDALLVGYYEGSRLLYAASVRAGFTRALREVVFSRFGSLGTGKCPFANLPEPRKGRWGEGLTAEDMKHCRWLRPRLVAAIEFLEWTPADHLRHAKFVGLRDDKKARDVIRERLV